MRAPFPWFGGKSRVAPLVWEAFGDATNYVEPFFGSGAVLLARPHEPRIETINDADCYVANFWRAVQADPDAVAFHCDWPVNEADLSARHQWLVDRAEWRARMTEDPEHYDARIAGWWVWGACAWIGSGWCDPAGARVDLSNAGQGVNRQLPHAGNAGRGVHRKLPHAGDAGRGVRTQLPDMAGSSSGGNQRPDYGKGINGATAQPVYEWMRSLAERLRRVRVACGDWSRVCTPSVTHRHGMTGVFLDPPYGEGALDYAAGGNSDTTLTASVREWAIANGDNQAMRIALCGYEGQHTMPETWRCVPWKANGGYGGGRGTQADANSYRERIWLSPHCMGARQPDLFARIGGAA